MGVLLQLRRPAAAADVGEALRLARTDPRRARALAEAARQASGGDVAAMVAADRAAGLAAQTLQDLPTATAHLRRAVEGATSAGMAGTAAETRVSLAAVLAASGQTDEALGELDRAAPFLSGPWAARMQAQRAFIFQRLGSPRETLRHYRRALTALRRTGDVESEAKLLRNRGIANAYCGRFSAAEADLTAAEARHLRLGQPLQVAEVRHGRGFVAARRGDVAAALQWYDRAEAEYQKLGVVRPVLLLDRAETLLSVRLVDQAREVGNRAAREFAEQGMAADLAEAELLMSQAALLAGDPGDAVDLATRAWAAFLAQDRPGWAALAGYAVVRATAGQLPPGPSMVAAARRAVDELDVAGWVGPAMDARVILARAVLESGPVAGAGADAAGELQVLARARARGPAELRARAWHATALWRQGAGDLAGADRALRAGCRAMALHQTTLGATELRVQVGGQAVELAEMGLELALHSARPERVLAWAERGRAGALRTRAARPPVDADLAGQLAELRQVVSALEQAGFEGGDAGPLVRRRTEVEARIQRTAWSASASGPRCPLAEPPTTEELTAALGPGALVEFVAHAGQLHAVVVSRGRARLVALASVAVVQSEVDALRFALSRLARGRGSRTSRQAAADSLRYSSDVLDALLLGPIGPQIDDRPLVLVPTGPLHALPWSTLPSVRDRDVTLSPSAALWFRAARAATREDGGTVLVAGPGLAHAPAEIQQLARAYPGATTLMGDQATAGQVATALDGAALVHVAAHGRFRADNPLFSSLRLADGPLTVYDLEGLAHAPNHLVLSACDVGLSSVRPGDELMGLTAALVAMGTQSLVASVVPVPDDVTRPLMVDFHRRRAGGAGPAAALAAAQAAARDGDDRIHALTAGFVCFGAA